MTGYNYSLFDQVIRSATSIGANMVEGGAGSTNRDFINFMHISLKSANETNIGFVGSKKH